MVPEEEVSAVEIQHLSPVAVDPKKPSFSHLLCNLLQRQESQGGTISAGLARRGSAIYLMVESAETLLPLLSPELTPHHVHLPTVLLRPLLSSHS